MEGSTKAGKAFWISGALMCPTFVNLLVRSAWMVGYVQWDVRMAARRHELQLPFLCENDVHAVGLAQIALCVMGLMILCIPYRKGELWAWLALATLLVLFVLPASGQWFPLAGLASLAEGIRHSGLAREAALNYLSPSLMLLGLLLSAPGFIRRTRAPGRAK